MVELPQPRARVTTQRKQSKLGRKLQPTVNLELGDVGDGFGPPGRRLRSGDALFLDAFGERQPLLDICAGPFLWIRVHEWVPFLALAAWPNAVGWIAGRLGIEYHTVLLLTVTTFFLVMNFKLLAIVSVQERRIACLAQLLALLTRKLDGEQDRGGSALPLQRTVDPDTDREVA